MQNDDLRQASDAVHSALKRFQLEPNEQTRQQLINVCKHYNNSGVHIKLRPDAVIIRAKAAGTGGT